MSDLYSMQIISLFSYFFKMPRILWDVERHVSCVLWLSPLHMWLHSYPAWFHSPLPFLGCFFSLYLLVVLKSTLTQTFLTWNVSESFCSAYISLLMILTCGLLTNLPKVRFTGSRSFPLLCESSQHIHSVHWPVGTLSCLCTSSGNWRWAAFQREVCLVNCHAWGFFESLAVWFYNCAIRQQVFSTPTASAGHSIALLFKLARNSVQFTFPSHLW